jgi:mRNA interferase MazF
VIVAPLASTIQPYPFRFESWFAKRAGSVILDQVRIVDGERLVKRLGVLSATQVAASLSLAHQRLRQTER